MWIKRLYRLILYYGLIENSDFENFQRIQIFLEAFCLSSVFSFILITSLNCLRRYYLRIDITWATGDGVQ